MTIPFRWVLFANLLWVPLASSFVPSTTMGRTTRNMPSSPIVGAVVLYHFVLTAQRKREGNCTVWWYSIVGSYLEFSVGPLAIVNPFDKSIRVNITINQSSENIQVRWVTVCAK